jgi:hypothetical protein
MTESAPISELEGMSAERGVMYTDVEECSEADSTTWQRKTPYDHNSQFLLRNKAVSEMECMYAGRV